MNKIAAAHEKELINNGCSLHIALKYNENQEEVPGSAKIVLEVTDDDKKKRTIELESYYSPENTAFF